MGYRTLDLADLGKELEELEAKAEAHADPDQGGDPLDEDETARLVELRRVCTDIGTDDLRLHARNREGTLIAACDFVQYTISYAEDVCNMSNASAWPFCFIDWNLAADDLARDFVEVTVDGEPWYIRST